MVGVGVGVDFEDVQAVGVGPVESVGDEGEGEDVLLWEVGEGVVVPLGSGPGGPVGVAGFWEVIGAEACWVGDIGDIEEGDLDAFDAAGGIGIAADADEEVVVDGVEVGGVAWDFEFAGDDGGERVGEVEGEEGVDLAEGDEVAAVADEASGVDLFGEPEACDAADGGEAVVGVGEDEDVIGGSVGGGGGGGDAE